MRTAQKILQRLFPISWKMGSCWHDKTRRDDAKRQQTWKMFEAAFRMGKNMVKQQQKLFLISTNIWGCMDTQGTLDFRNAASLRCKLDIRRMQTGSENGICHRSARSCWQKHNQMILKVLNFNTVENSAKIQSRLLIIMLC